MTDVGHKNMLAVLQHSKNNKSEIDDLFRHVAQLQAENMLLNQRLDAMIQQLQLIQVKLFSGGATSGNLH